MSAAVPTTDSYMYQTMHRQPIDVRRMLAEGWEPARAAAELLQDARRVLLVGIGTSFHAALVGAWLLRAAGSDARAVSSFDLAKYPGSVGIRADDAVILMAHTGLKQVSTAALRRATDADATVISVGSRTAEHPGSQLVLRTVDREQSAAFTSSHVTAMTALAQIATELGEARTVPATAGFRNALEALPDQIAGVLAREGEVLPISRLAAERRIYAAGAGPNEATALEAVIKVREAAYGWIDALALEQFMHGPIVAVNAGDVAALVNVPGPSVERVGQIAATLDALGATVWLIGDPVATVPNAVVFNLPHTDELISPLLAVVPLQVLAYQIAALRGINPDTFRRDDPTYARAFELSPLRADA
jgi:glucosamine--fructose-6-phosphate aminotransferase (isomerizing)